MKDQLEIIVYCKHQIKCFLHMKCTYLKRSVFVKITSQISNLESKFHLNKNKVGIVYLAIFRRKDICMNNAHTFM